MSFKFTNDNINSQKETKVENNIKLARQIQINCTKEKAIPTVIVVSPLGNALATIDKDGNPVTSKLEAGSVFATYELEENEAYVSVGFKPSQEGLLFIQEEEENGQAIIVKATDDRFAASYIYNRETKETRTTWKTMHFDMEATKIMKRISVLNQQHHVQLQSKVVYLTEGQTIAPEDKQEDTLYVEFRIRKMADGDNRMNTRAANMLGADDCVFNARLMGFHESSWGAKGDYLVGRNNCLVFASGADIVIYSDNVNPELGLTKEHADTLLIGVTTPQHQYKPVRSNPQLEAAFGRSLYDIMDNHFASQNVWDVEAAKMMGRMVGTAMLGLNVFPSKGFDGELKGAAEAAEYLVKHTGSTLPSRWLYQFGLGRVKIRFDKAGMKFGDAFRKERIITPHAFSLSIRSEALLEDFGITPPEDFGEEHPFFFTRWGVVVHSSIYKDFTDSTGGSDLDDKVAVMMGVLSEDVTIGMRHANTKELSFSAGETVFLITRFPLGGRLTNGRMGVEYWLGRPCANDKLFGKQLDKAVRKDGPMRKFAQGDFPTHILDVEEPKHTEPRASEKLTASEQAERLLELQGVFGTYSLRMASLIWLAMNHPAIFNKVVAGRSLSVSMEFAIDASTQFFNLGDIELIKEASDEAHEMIIEIVNLIGKVDYMFAHRTQLTSKFSTEKKPDFIPEINSSVAIEDWNGYMVNRKAWKRSVNKTNTFMNRMSEVYTQQFENGIPSKHFGKKNLKDWKKSMVEHEGNFNAVANDLGENENFVSDLLRAQFAVPANVTRANDVSRTVFGTKLAAEVTDILSESNAVSKMIAKLHTAAFEPMLAKLDMNDPFDQAIVKGMIQAWSSETVDRVIDWEAALALGDELDKYRGLDGFESMEIVSIDQPIWDEEDEINVF